MPDTDLFISSLRKEIQYLCHKHMRFDINVDIEGYIDVIIDNNINFEHFVLKENVKKNPNKKVNIKQHLDGVHTKVPHSLVKGRNIYIKKKSVELLNSTNDHTKTLLLKKLLSKKEAIKHVSSQSSSSKVVEQQIDKQEQHNSTKVVVDLSFKCVKCNLIFLRSTDYEKHNNEMHKDGNLYKCDICTKRFRDIEQLVAHVKVLPSQNQNKCMVCGLLFTRIGCLEEHNNIHKDHNYHTQPACSVIEEADEFPEQLCNEKDRNSNATKTPIDIEHQIFNNELGLYSGTPFCPDDSSHTQRKTESGNVSTKIIFCVKCDKKFQRFTDLEKHFAEIHKDSDDDFHKEANCFVEEEEEVPEQMCNEQDTTVNASMSPIYIEPQLTKPNNDKIVVKDNRPCNMSCNYKCLICSKSCSCTSDLEKHFFEEHKDVVDRSCKCFVCSNTFSSTSNLEKHFNEEHKDGKLYKCDICFKKISDITTFVKHLIFIPGEPQHKCMVCGLVFTRKVCLEEHNNIHKLIDNETLKKLLQKKQDYVNKVFNTVEGSGKCAVCNKTFSSHADLDKHYEEVHIYQPLTKQNNVCKCAVCNKNFSSYAVLDKHYEDEHRGEIQYKCNICNTSFIEKVSFIKHVTDFSDRTENKCTICGLRFTRKACLKEHQNTHQSENTSTATKDTPIGTKDTPTGTKDTPINTKGMPTCSVVADRSEICKCLKCNNIFPCLSDLNKHYNEVHKNGIQFKCGICSKKCRDMTDFIEHMKTIPGETKNECIVCGLLFTSKACLKEHNKNHRNLEQRKFYQFSKVFRCDVCGLKLDRLSLLYAHRKKVHANEMPFKCFICEESFRKLNLLKKHSYYVHKLGKQYGQQYECNMCGASYCTLSHLKRHNLTHIDDKPYICDVCGKGFKIPQALKVHSKHHSEKQFLCKTCGKSFAVLGNLKKHNDTVHIGYRSFICNVCGKGFTAKENLNQHKFVHTSERPLQCSICGKRFRYANELAKHKKSHSSEKPYKCKICGISFKYSLKKHMLLHGGERPYKCNICGKGFITARTLDYHSYSHANITNKVKPIMCEICGKSFIRKEQLISHARVHTGEKPYKCKVCGSNFSSLSVLISHTRTHTGEKPYKCNICSKQFARGSDCKRHFKIHKHTVLPGSNLFSIDF